MEIETIKVGDYRTNCYLVYDKDSAFLVDPGDEGKKILQKINDLGVKSVDKIFLTHGHFDHLMAVDEIMQKYPEAEVFMSEDDLFLVNDIFEQGIFVHKYLHKFKSKIIAVKEGDVINIAEKRIKIIETPGHTPGGLCFLCDDNLFSGDTLFYQTIGRLDLPFSSSQKMKESLEKLYKLEPHTKVLPGHGKTTTIAQELNYKDYWGL